MHGLKALGDKGFGGLNQENDLHQRFWEDYSTSTMRAIADKDVDIIARVLKRGRSLVFDEIEMRAAGDERLAMHVATTYALMG